MSAAEVLAQHRLITHESSLHSNTYSCSCNDAGECAMGVTTNWRVHAGHQIDALRAAGYAVTELPKSNGPDDDGQLWFGDFDIRVDTTGRNGPEVWHGDNEVTPAMLRQVASEFLAAAHAAEVSVVE